MRTPSSGPRPGPGSHRTMSFEKPKNSGKAFTRLFRYFGKSAVLLIASIIFIIAGVVLNTVAPRILGGAITEHIEKSMNLTAFIKQMMLLSGIYAGAFITQSCSGILLALMSNKVLFRMRKEAFHHIQRLSISYFDRKGIGDLISRLTNDMEMVYNFLSNGFSNTVQGTLTLLAVLIGMLSLNIPLTGSVLLTFPLVALIMIRFGKRIKSSTLKNQKQVGALSSSIEESVSGMKVIQSFHREKEEYAKFEKVNRTAMEAAVDMERKSFVMMPMMRFINGLSLAFVILIGGVLTIRNPAVYSIGLLTTFLIYARRFFEPLRQLSSVYALFQSALAGSERVFEIFDSEEEIRNPADPFIPESVEGCIDFREVHFHYEEGKPVLSDLSFRAESGKITAIVGPTGAGKTTIINLLARFYDVDKGEILLDGRNIKEYDIKSLRKQMGIVLQEPFFFAGTIRENLLYGCPGAEEDQIIRAAELANAHSFITRLPEGYETKLIERGMNLSQGERQLLAIARTILADPSILILDEATSSIDSFTEIKIQEGLSRLMKNRTSIIIAHRLSTIKNADQLLVVHNRSIIEKGSHKELMAARGFYYRMYSLQFEKAEITEDMNI